MSIYIRPHHQQAITNLAKEYEHDDRFPALIIGGSVAKGSAREDSDVDFMIVANDEEYSQRLKTNDLFINRTDLTDYKGGYVDGKIINLQYLKDAAEKGNEPTRAAFDGAFLAYSNIDNLDQYFSKIHRYPVEGHSDRIKSFYSMAFIQNWLMGEAERHGNIYTITRAASQLTLFAGRLILAHNKILFPYHKWFINYLEKCPQKPTYFVENIHAVLKEPGTKTSGALFESLQDFYNWDIPDLDAYLWFMKEVEWSWMDGTTPLEDI